MKRFEDFTRQYSLSKTLRFEARPVGATLSHIIQSKLLEEDQHRSESYQKVKKLIDEYHKKFIDLVMNGFALPLEDNGRQDSLAEYYTCYLIKNRDEAMKKRFEQIQSSMRQAISKSLSTQDAYKRIFKKELIEEDLLSFIDNADAKQLNGMAKEDARNLVKEFKGFASYFTGFHQNRANMYSEEEKSTAIAYRLVNENLPRFVDNIDVFAKVAAVPEMKEILEQLYADFEMYLNVDSIQEMFQLNYYNVVLTQAQIEVYNSIIGGKTDKEGKVKIRGLNEYINLYNQKHKETRLPKLKTLYKQILSDRVAVSWLPEEFENDQQALCAIRDYYEQLQDKILGETNLKILLESLGTYDLDGIFIRNDAQLTEISQRWFGHWSVIEKAIKADIMEIAPGRKRKETEEDYQMRIANIYKQADSFSIQYINECVRKTNPNECRTIEGYFATLGAVDTLTEQSENLIYRINNAYTDTGTLLSSPYPEDKKMSQDADSVEKIKNLLDALKTLQWFVKPLLGKGDESGKDERFYGELDLLWKEIDILTPLYNKVRDHMTKKPYSRDKIKLNFENAQLLDGWDENKETANACIVLRRNGLYYLAVMNKDNRTLLSKRMPSDGECYEKMIYKQFDISKQLPKCTTETKPVKEAMKQGKGSYIIIDKKKWNSQLEVSREIWELNNLVWNQKEQCFVLRKEDDKRPKKFQIDYLKKANDRIGYNEAKSKWIEFAKDFVAKYKSTSIYDIKFKDDYDSVDDFYKDLNCQFYKISFRNVSVSYIDQLVEEGKMYLFQIYNKDFSAFSKGTPNLHTLYWNALFDERNLADVVYKLNGQAELFFRKRSIEVNHPTHPAHRPIKNKNKQNTKEESIFPYDLIKDRRYTVDQFEFHVPITMNFKSVNTPNINQETREYLQLADDTHVIGVDRGERNLLYLVVVDKQGNIKEQSSLNEIVNQHNGNTYRTDYHGLLDEREKARLVARQSWQTIENIKELKEGYLSQVIHRITQLMVKYHAIVVLEDLNMGFMRGRQKVEKQVYQKFEKMLIDKLNYLVDKNAEINVPGGLLRAYQLTSPFDSFKALGKQSGFLFYIPAWNTSKIDPVTGFVNLFDVRYESVEKSKLFFAKFKSIRYNDEKGWFELAFDYNDFNSKAEGTQTRWTLCTHGERILTFRNPDKNNEWDCTTINLTEQYQWLFSRYGIDVHGNLKEAICCQTEKDFFEELLKCLKLTLQMRNSRTGTSIDYMISPVADENGHFYDSRSCDASLPQDADANGAYNIARKGLMLINQIKKAEDLDKLKFDITNKSWLNFAQQKPYLND